MVTDGTPSDQESSSVEIKSDSVINEEENDAILKTLLDTAGIKSAISHDIILQGSSRKEQMYQTIQTEGSNFLLHVS